MSVTISNEFVINDFESILNGVLKSSKKSPLIEKKGIKFWHEGKGTKLLKVQNNKIYFSSIFKFLKSKLGNKEIEIMVSANLDHNQENILFSYQAKNIKNFPSWLETILKTNKIAYHSINIPKELLFFKDEKTPFELEIEMPVQNAISVYIVIPLETSKLVRLREKPKSNGIL